MLPIGDDNSARRTVPVVTYALIVLNILFLHCGITQWRAVYYPLVLRTKPVPFQSHRGFPDAFQFHVHACRMGPPHQQHALLVDLW